MPADSYDHFTVELSTDGGVTWGTPVTLSNKTTVATAFTVPAAGTDVVVAVADASWIVENTDVNVVGKGRFNVVRKSVNDVTLKYANTSQLDAMVNTHAGETVAVGTQVVPGSYTDESVPSPTITERTTGFTANSNQVPYNLPSVSSAPFGSWRWNRFFKGLDNFKTCQVLGIAVSPTDSGIFVVGAFQGPINGTSFDPPSGSILISADAGYDVFLVKLNSSGVFQWAKKFGQNLDDKAFVATCDSSGNVIVGGNIGSGSVNFGGGNLPFQGLYDGFVAKFDSSGNHLWSRGFGETSNDTVFGLGVDSLNNVWVGMSVGYGGVDCGSPVGTLTGIGSVNSIILKLAGATGASLVGRRISQAAGEFGNSNELKSLAVDSANNVIIGGYFTGNPDFGGGSRAAGQASGVLYLAKYNSAGVYQWDRTWETTGFSGCYGVAIDRNENDPDPLKRNAILITGPFAGTAAHGIGNGASISTAGGTACHVVRYSAANLYNWHKLYGGNPNTTDVGTGIALDVNGNISVVASMVSVLNFGGIFIFGNGAANYVIMNIGRDQSERWAKRVFNPVGFAVAATPLQVIAGGQASLPVDFGGGSEPADPNHPGVEGFVVAYSA